MSEFDGQIAVITGAAQGIGYATAEKLKQDGAKIVIWDMDKNLGETAAQKLDCDFLQMDMTDDKIVEKCTSETLGLHGKIDILVCSAGIAGPTMPTWDYPVNEWLKVMNVNVNGVYYCNRHVIKTMREKGYGRIVNIASIAGKEGNPNAGAELFKSAKLGCIACHKIDDTGGVIGPDLSALGSGVPFERIVTEVMWPTLQVKEGFSLTRVVTKKSQTLQGYEQASRDKDMILLIVFSSGRMHRI